MKKIWCIKFLSAFILFLIIFGGLVVVVDPFFHYHKPLKCLAYTIYNERYQNDGIVKHFDYDAIITGTSMVQNFKCSEMNDLFGVKSIKVPFAGASYQEISENLERAFSANPNITTVIWGLDYNRFYEDFNATKFDTYPYYLYDLNPFNDVNYIFNKKVLFGEVFIYTLDFTHNGGSTTTFDEYNNWEAQYTYGKDSVLSQITRVKKIRKARIKNWIPLIWKRMY